MPPFTSGLNPQVCLIRVAFWRPFLWCLAVWNTNSEDRKGRFIFEVVYEWPLVACALGFEFSFKK